MPLKPQSLRKGTIVIINGVETEKDEVILLSKEWEEKHIDLFKKMTKQGGKFKIQGNTIEIYPASYITNSKGEKHSNITIKSPGPDDRF